MHPKRWPQVESVFHNALRIPLTKRESFVFSETNGDQDLYFEVISLLHSHEAESLLDHGAATIAADWLSATTHDLHPGSRIGPYEISAEIGRGGMGAVYQARDTRLHRDVALKFVREERVGSTGRFPHFEGEVRAASALNHPNVVTIHDVGSADGVPYVACEFVDGVTLRERLAAGLMDLSDVISVGLQIAEALAVAHRAGIVHRDIKPENIMIRRDGLVKVLDFGLAMLTAAGLGSDAGCTSGTPRYMSPEQLRGAPAGAQTDVYSLGLVLYEMATGARPSSAMMLARLPSDLRDVVSRSVAADPVERYPSGSEMKAALENVASGRRHPQRISGPRVWLALGVLTTLTAGLFAFLHSRPERTLTRVTPVPLTAAQGWEAGGSFSPDGNQIAYAWKDVSSGVQSHIYVKTISSGRPVSLTTSQNPEYVPTWSPDGRKIAFIRELGQTNAIYLIPPLGGTERKLTDGHFGGSMSWSPDSKFLAIADMNSPRDNRPLVYLISAEDGQKKRLTTPANKKNWDQDPAFSPNGHKLVFTRCEGPYDCSIYQLDLTNDYRSRGEPRLVRRETRSIAGLAWTPDGKEIVYAVSDDAGLNHHLMRTRLGSSNPPELLTYAGERSQSPVIANHGHLLAYTRDLSDFDVWQVQPGKPAHSFLSSTRLEFSPQFSPDGKHVAFSSNRSGTMGIWVCDQDGRSAVQLTHFERASGSPQWSPDGHWIAFDRQLREGWRIFVMPSEGGPAHRLTSDEEHENMPSWSRDGKWIYYASNRTGRSEIWKAPTAGGKGVQVTQNGGFTAFESQNHELLYYTKTEFSGLWSVPLQGGAEKLVLQSVTWRNFVVAGDGIYYFPRPGPDGLALISFYNFASAKKYEIARVRQDIFIGMTVSPDRNTVLFSVVSRAGSNIMVIENFR